MTTKEADRLHHMKLILDKSSPQKYAAMALGCSDRHVRRLLKSYKEKGEKGLISERRGRPSNNRTAPSLQKQVIDLINSHYNDFGPTLATEKLSKCHERGCYFYKVNIFLEILFVLFQGLQYLPCYYDNNPLRIKSLKTPRSRGIAYDDLF